MDIFTFVAYWLFADWQVEAPMTGLILTLMLLKHMEFCLKSAPDSTSVIRRISDYLLKATE